MDSPDWYGRVIFIPADELVSNKHMVHGLLVQEDIADWYDLQLIDNGLFQLLPTYITAIGVPKNR